MRDGSILTLSRRRGMIDWMRKVIIFLLKAKKRNRNAKEGDAQLFGESLLGFRGTLSQAGKPCSVSEGHFPGWEKLARFPRDISPDGKSLLGFRGTFSQAEKPCRAAQEHFPGRKNLAAFCGRVSTIICSLQSFPIRPHQGVCPCAPTLGGEKLTRNDTIHHRIPQRINGKYVFPSNGFVRRL